MDESGFLYGQMPHRRLSSQNASGVKSAKDIESLKSFAAMLMAHTRSGCPSLTRNSEDPWSFKKWLPSLQGIQYLNNKSA